MMLVYDIQDVSKQYPGQTQPANQNITLQIQAGEIFGILGDNGAGKTTLLRQMVNLSRPTTGRILLFGREVSGEPRYVPCHVGYMPQHAHALNSLTAGEALYFTAHLRGLRPADARRERDELLGLWQIGPLRDKYSTRLSGGEQRLLRLAVAMAGLTPVLILDEPTNDLAPQRRHLVWEVLSQVNRQRGTTIIFITHDAIEAEKAIQRVGIMREGRLVAVGRPGELKRELDQTLRLELVFAPEFPPALPVGLQCRAIQPGRWLARVQRHEVGAILNALNFDQIEDVRLHSPTLEDLYVHYTAQSSN
jgi:ABC-type multidrug transport system ATPase subunit